MKHQVSKTRGELAKRAFEKLYGVRQSARFYTAGNPDGAGYCLYFGVPKGVDYLVSLFDKPQMAFMNADYLNRVILYLDEVQEPGPRFIVELNNDGPNRYLNTNPHPAYRLVNCEDGKRYIWELKS